MRNSGSSWSAGCDESRTSGAEGGPGKRAGSNPSTAPRSDPYIIGKGNASAIGTLVERTTGYTLLVPLTDGFKAEQVAPATGRKDQDSARAAAPDADLGPRRGDERLETGPDRHRHRHLLLRSALTLAAGHQREHCESGGGLRRADRQSGVGCSG